MPASDMQVQNAVQSQHETGDEYNLEPGCVPPMGRASRGARG